MRFLIFTLLFVLPYIASAASFELDATTTSISVGESTTVTMSVSSDAASVYTAQAILSFDENVLEIENIVFSKGWIPLSQPGHNEEIVGRIIKTAGFPGGVTSKTAFLTFSVRKVSSGVGVISVESTSKIYNKESVNIADVFDTQVFPATAVAPVASLPPAFAIAEVSSEAEEVLPVVEKEEAPIEEVTEKIILPAAVITFGGNVPYIPLFIFLLILLAGGAIYFILWSGRKGV